MKIVLDANVFFSAHLWGGNPYRIVERYAEGLDTLKKPKFNLTQDRIDSIIASIERYGQKISIPLNHQVIGVCRDADDDKYISCAIAAKADYIVSGDQDLLVLREYSGIKIVTVSAYLDIVIGGSERDT